MRAKFHDRAKLVLILLNTACAGGGAPGLWHRSDDGTSTGAVVSARELASATGSLMEALDRLRPWMVAPRLTPIFVTIDDAPPTDLSILKTIPATTVYEVRLRRTSSDIGRIAISATGASVVGDIIAVTTRQATGRWR